VNDLKQTLLGEPVMLLDDRFRFYTMPLGRPQRNVLIENLVNDIEFDLFRGKPGFSEAKPTWAFTRLRHRFLNGNS
jgi:hypothetical protein